MVNLHVSEIEIVIKVREISAQVKGKRTECVVIVNIGTRP